MSDLGVVERLHAIRAFAELLLRNPAHFQPHPAEADQAENAGIVSPARQPRPDWQSPFA